MTIVNARKSRFNTHGQRFKTIVERFFEKCEIYPLGGCWKWTGASQWDEYGSFWINRHNVQSHRASWIIHRGEIPEGMLVLHTCDNHWCVNPDHLFLGTHKDNTHDMIKKGRDHSCRESRRGINSNFSKLTPQSVLEIFESRSNQELTARKYGITQTAVSLIRRGKNWSWLTKKKGTI